MIITNSSEDEIKPDGKAKAVIPELQRRIETLEKMVYASKEILNLEEAARFIGVLVHNFTNSHTHMPSHISNHPANSCTSKEPSC